MTISISVVVPTYNRQKQIGRAIRSIINQTYSDWELIIVDDGSTDWTPEIVGQFDDPRIRYEYQNNSGANVARNNGIQIASGELISFLDSDDELLEHHLERVIELYRDSPDDCIGVATSYKSIDPDQKPGTSYTPDKLIRFDDVIDGNVVGSFSATTFEKKILVQLGGLDTKIPASQDYEFYLRALSEGYNIRGTRDILLRKYESDDNISSNVVKKRKAFRYLNEKHGDKLSPSRVAEQHYMLGHRYAESNEMKSARQEFLNALCERPLNGVYLAHYIASLGGKNSFAVFRKMKSIWR